MKTRTLLTLFLIGTLCLVGTLSHAEEIYPAKVVITAELPVGTLHTAPTGKAKALGEQVAAAYKQHKVTIRQAVDKNGVFTGTIFVRVAKLKKAEHLNLRWVSNCSVNSGFEADGPAVQRFAARRNAKPQAVIDEETGELLEPAAYNPPWFEEVFALWTRQRHDFPAAAIKNYAYTPGTNYDITFDRRQVKAYRLKLSALQKPSAALVSR